MNVNVMEEVDLDVSTEMSVKVDGVSLNIGVAMGTDSSETVDRRQRVGQQRHECTSERTCE